MRKVFAVAVVAVVSLAACGGGDEDGDSTAAAGTDDAATETAASEPADDEGDGGGDLGDKQAEVAQMLLDDADKEGMTLDEDCVRDKAAQLGDADAQILIDNAESDSLPDLSPEGEALTFSLFDCVPQEEFVDILLEDIPEDGIDKDCVREQLLAVDLDPAMLASGTPPAELQAALASCVVLPEG